MKRVYLPVLICSVLCAGCTADLIETTSAPVATTSDDSDPEELEGSFDFIDGVSFPRTVSITWSGSTATVEGDTDGIVSVNGSMVTADSRNLAEPVKYILSGSSSDGCFKLYSTVKQALVLKDLTLAGSSGAAINNQSHKRTFVVLEGTSSLSDCAVNASGNYPGEDGSEDMKAAFFSEGQLVFSGSGSLNVTAVGKAAITSDDYLRFLGPQTVRAASSAGHALRGKDAINSSGDMHLSGGLVCGWSTGNDAIDANGNMYVDGATVYAVSTKGNPEVAMDANTEGGKKLYLQSGSLVAVGGIESGSSITGTAYSASGWAKNSWHTLYDASGNAVLTFKTPSSSSNSTMVLYSSGKAVSLKSGVSVSGGTQIFGGNGCSGASVSGGSSVSTSTYSGNNSFR